MNSAEPGPDNVEVLMREVARLTALEQSLRAEKEELIEARRSWEESLDHYTDVFELGPLPSFTVDKIGFVREANAAARESLGASVVGSALRNRVLQHDRRSFLDLITGALRARGATVEREVSLHRQDGEVVRTRMGARQLSRGPAALLITMLDLTDHDRTVEEQRRLQARAQEATAATAARDTFIAMLSHELRTPLTPVLAAVSAALRAPDAPPRLQKTFAMIARNIEAERRLIDDLLDTTRIAHGKMRVERVPLDLHRVARGALDAMLPQLEHKGLTMSVELNADHAWVNADAGRLRQVIWNLLQNAVKFSAEGGVIGMRSWNRDGVVAIEVRDGGSGIAPEMLARLFRPFQQGHVDSALVSSRSGLGLGLAICRGILDLHDGAIHAASPGLGHGARFVVDLPFIDAVTAPEEQAPIEVSPAFSRDSKAAEPRILLVEDDEDTAETLAELLRSEGFQISVAKSIASALRHDVGEVDLVLTDIGLGDGSGLDLMRRLRAKKNIPGIVLSGYGTEADIVASQEAGFSAHLVKPVSIDKLVATIHRTRSGSLVGIA